ncbi:MULTISPECIES: transposase [Flectobacillus]|uniref:transposase n=1 Tax=Flectobacillus TaxID=101 RepID=UPI0014136158|nr:MULTISPECIES: transposase [Flectobacillus]MDI9867659.1 transposase [Flectobacillus roseus]NBA75431.1 transposase [Emticicia sp. ODNR4P]
MKYSNELIFEILNEMLSGKSMNAIAREKGIPISTIFSWKQQHIEYYTKIEDQKEKFRRLKENYQKADVKKSKVK